MLKSEEVHIKNIKDKIIKERRTSEKISQNGVGRTKREGCEC